MRAIAKARCERDTADAALAEAAESVKRIDAERLVAEPQTLAVGVRQLFAGFPDLQALRWLIPGDQAKGQRHLGVPAILFDGAWLLSDHAPLDADDEMLGCARAAQHLSRDSSSAILRRHAGINRTWSDYLIHGERKGLRMTSARAGSVDLIGAGEPQHQPAPSPRPIALPDAPFAAFLTGEVAARSCALTAHRARARAHFDAARHAALAAQRAYRDITAQLLGPALIAHVQTCPEIVAISFAVKMPRVQRTSIWPGTAEVERISGAIGALHVELVDGDELILDHEPSQHPAAAELARQWAAASPEGIAAWVAEDCTAVVDAGGLRREPIREMDAAGFRAVQVAA